MTDKFYRIGEKFLLNLDSKIKDVMLIAYNGEGFLEAWILDLDTGELIMGPMGIAKSRLNKIKGRYCLTEEQMKGLLTKPRSLQSIGVGVPEAVIHICGGSVSRVVSKEALQVFVIDDTKNAKKRVFCPGYPEHIREATDEIENYWDEEWE